MPEVRVHAGVSPLAAQALVTLAANRRVARVVLVPDARGAEVAWFGDPGEALREPERLVPASAPEQPDVPERWKDPWRRYFPVAARARVLLLSPRAPLPSRPARLRDLADPRLAGMQALVPFGKGEGPTTVAALAVLFGDQAALGLLDGLARARPQLASAVVYPDQAGFGTLVFPTAAALLESGRASEGARRLVEWLAGADAEQLMVARAPGYMPLRPGVPVPPGVRPAGDVRAPALDWERVAAKRRLLEPLLERWPAP
jgi:iron(III) transport system substrate-binding protein